MSRCHNRVVPALLALGASALLAAAAFIVNVAEAQSHGNRGAAAAGQMQRPAGAINDHMPQRAMERIPQQAKDKALPLGGTLPTASQDELAKAQEKAADEAKAVAPPLGGTLPEESQAEGLAIASEKAADEAKTVAAPLGGDPANAPPEVEPTE